MRGFFIAVAQQINKADAATKYTDHTKYGMGVYTGGK
jgi:hypothetical protein